VPFFEISGISYTGNVNPEDMTQINILARWAAHDEQGQPKTDAYYFCGDHFLELIGLMEEWRVGGLTGTKAWIEQQLTGSGKSA
jgi:hypothetical protein